MNGPQDWSTANSWANSLVFGGYSDWRLPTMIDTGASGCDFGFSDTDCGYNVDTATSEIAHLFHVTLGNLSAYDTSGNYRGSNPAGGWGLTNTGEFQNLQSDGYWSGLVYAPNPSVAWVFDTGYGNQGGGTQNNALYALAVRPGDVAAAVPEPQAVVLVLTALGAMALVRRRRPR